MVKSAIRTLQILEFFDDVQREATVTEVAEALAVPQSSTSSLLRTLVAAGFLNYCAPTRSYALSLRAALLGQWVSQRLMLSKQVLHVMEELNRRTGDIVVLAVRNGLFSQYIHVLQATNAARVHLTVGSVRPIAASGTGYALLSHLSDAEVTRIVLRANAEAKTTGKTVKLREVLARVDQIRRTGHSLTVNLFNRGIATIAVCLPPQPGQPPLVIGLSGLSEVLVERKDELAALVKDVIARNFAR